MSIKIDNALQDISIIKETLEDSKVHYRGMYLICFLMAALNGVKYLWTLLEIRYLPSMMIGAFFSSNICPILFVVSYLCIYRNEKKYSNKYYLSMLGIWGFMAGVIPAMTALVNLIGFWTGREHAYDSAAQMRGSDFMDSIANIMLVSVFLIICAYILNKRIYILLAILNLLSYMLLEKCFTSDGIPFPVGGQPQTKLTYSSVYSIVVTSLGYMALGFYLRWLKEKKKDEYR